MVRIATAGNSTHVVRQIVRVATFLCCWMLLPNVVVADRRPNLGPDEIVRSFYSWYCRQSSTPTCDALTPVADLFDPAMLALLCGELGQARVESPRAESTGDPFTGIQKASSFHIWKTDTNGDVSHVYVRLFGENRFRDVDVKAQYFGQWVITDIRYDKQHSFVKNRGGYRPAAPPN